MRAWDACEAAGLALWACDEPLDTPHDRLTLVMAGFEFERVWNERRLFIVDGVEIPVARLAHIVEWKVTAGREKDRLLPKNPPR